MIRSLAFTPNHRARVWQGELPSFNTNPVGVIEEIAVARRQPPGRASKAAVELFWPTGPRWLYGLLGASYAPSEGRLIRLSIPISEFSGEAYRHATVVTARTAEGSPLDRPATVVTHPNPGGSPRDWTLPDIRHCFRARSSRKSLIRHGTFAPYPDV